MVWATRFIFIIPSRSEENEEKKRKRIQHIEHCLVLIYAHSKWIIGKYLVCLLNVFFSIHRFSHIILLSFFHSPKRNSFVCSVVSCKWIMSFGLLLWFWYRVALSNYASFVCVSVLTNAHITLEVCISQPFECSLFGRHFFPSDFQFHGALMKRTNETHSSNKH